MNNLKNKKMLNKFVKHLDKRGPHFGWYLISKESYEDFIFNCDLTTERQFYNKEVFKINTTWEEISDEELQYQIYLFLKDYDKNHDEDWIED